MGARSGGGGGAGFGSGVRRGGDIDSLVGKSINFKSGFANASVTVTKNNGVYSIDRVDKMTNTGKSYTTSDGRTLTKDKAQNIINQYLDMYPNATIK